MKAHDLVKLDLDRILVCFGFGLLEPHPPLMLKFETYGMIF